MTKWKNIRREVVASHDGSSWEIDLLDKELFPPGGRAGAILHHVMAAAYREKERQFEVADRVAFEDVEKAQRAVMTEARRRIQEGDWQASGSYQL